MLVCIDRKTAFCSMALVRVVFEIQAGLTGHLSIEVTVLIPPTRTSSEKHSMSTRTFGISYHSTDIDSSLEKSSRTLSISHYNTDIDSSLEKSSLLPPS